MANSQGTAQLEQVKVGNWLSFTSYIKVLEVRGTDLKVEDQNGTTFGINQKGGAESLVNKTMHAASTYTDITAVNRTQIIEKMLSAGDAVMRVTFNKQVDPKTAFEKVKTGNVLKSHAAQKKQFEEALKGEERTLIGYILKEEGGMGRTLFYDLEAKAPRLVDHRGIEKLVLKGSLYNVV